MSRFYLVVSASDVADRMADPDCYTTDPRYNVARSQAVLSYTEEQAGGLDHPDAVALMATTPWTGSVPS
tara:strand:- start:647 stop:853 length:207 start_codon:yes stop_codon:yes gene_type:complete